MHHTKTQSITTRKNNLKNTEIEQAYKHGVKTRRQNKQPKQQEKWEGKAKKRKNLKAYES